MAFSWGDTNLYILRDSYMPPWAEASILEIPLAPDPANIDAVSTVLQQQGRKRQTVSFSTYTKDYSVYTSMQADYLAGTVRTFTGSDGYSASMIIFSLSQATRKIYPTRYEFSVTLMEVAP